MKLSQITAITDGTNFNPSDIKSYLRRCNDIASHSATIIHTAYAARAIESIMTDPTTHREAMNHPHSVKWREAEQDEMQSVNSVGTWTLVESPNGYKAYRLYDPTTKETFISRNVRFVENQFVDDNTGQVGAMGTSDTETVSRLLAVINESPDEHPAASEPYTTATPRHRTSRMEMKTTVSKPAGAISKVTTSMITTSWNRSHRAPRHYAHEQVASRAIKLQYINTEEMVADLLTKPLPRDRHQALTKEMGVAPPPQPTAPTRRLSGSVGCLASMSKRLHPCDANRSSANHPHATDATIEWECWRLQSCLSV